VPSWGAWLILVSEWCRSGDDMKKTLISESGFRVRSLYQRKLQFLILEEQICSITKEETRG
jgi:hypothetical protein